MSCKNSCNLCKNLVISQSVTLVDDTVVIDLPTRNYNDGCKYCVIISQNIPDDAPISSLVAFSIGGDTTTLYPLVRCDCSQVSVCAIRTRKRYSLCVSTTATGGVFKSLGGLYCQPINNLESLPVPATTTPAPAVLRATPNKVTKTTTTKKEVVSNE